MLRSLLTIFRQRHPKAPDRLGSNVRVTVNPRDPRRENAEHLTAVLRTLRARGMTQAEIGQAIRRALETEHEGSPPSLRLSRSTQVRHDGD
jgi:hypothetical protein